MVASQQPFSPAPGPPFPIISVGKQGPCARKGRGFPPKLIDQTRQQVSPLVLGGRWLRQPTQPTLVAFSSSVRFYPLRWGGGIGVAHQPNHSSLFPRRRLWILFFCRVLERGGRVEEDPAWGPKSRRSITSHVAFYQSRPIAT